MSPEILMKELLSMLLFILELEEFCLQLLKVNF